MPAGDKKSGHLAGARLFSPPHPISVVNTLKRRELFARLVKNGRAPAPTLMDWRALLAESYARKYKRIDAVCELQFNIKNNVLFVNGEVDFSDRVYHELEIPYRWTDAGEPGESSFLTPEIEAQLDVRMLVVNGLLLLQVGRFDKEYSPKYCIAAASPYTRPSPRSLRSR
jgi:hypothetical protein